MTQNHSNLNIPILRPQTRRATDDSPVSDRRAAPKPAPRSASHCVEIGGPTGPEPTRYGDWEVKGRCSDF